MEINISAMQLHELGVDLEQEDDAARFLEVMLEQDPERGLLEMKRTRLIKQVIKALGLDNECAKGKYTPLKSKPLVKDINGKSTSVMLLATAASWVCSCICLDILVLTSPLLSTVVLDTCSVLNICLSKL